MPTVKISWKRPTYVNRAPRFLKRPLNHGLKYRIWCGNHPAPPDKKKSAQKRYYNLYLVTLALERVAAQRITSSSSIWSWTQFFFLITESNICRKTNFMVCFVSNAPEELELLDWQDALLSPTLSQESALASAQWVRTWWNLRNSWWIVQQFSNLMSARSCCALVRHSPWSLTRVRSSLTQLCSTLAEKYTFLQFFSVFSPFHPWEQ